MLIGECCILKQTKQNDFRHKNTNTGPDLERSTFNTRGVASGAGTAYPSGTPEFIPACNRVRVTRSFALSCMFCRSLFVLLSFFFWPLCCLSFFDVRLLITPLVSSKSSLKHENKFIGR